MEIVDLPLEEVLALPTYPTADIFPMLLEGGKAPDGYEGMTIDQFSNQIAKEGVREPLTIWRGFLLDGRNRREAVRLANKATPGLIETIPVRYVEFEDEEEADSWVLSLNIDRRSLNKDQLACLAVRFGWEVEAKRSEERMKAGKSDPSTENSTKGRTSDNLSRRFHVSRDYIDRARSLYLNDRFKFEKAASGREKVIGKMVSPGQHVTPDDPDTPYVADQKLYSDGERKIKESIRGFRKSDFSEKRLQTLLENLDTLKEFAATTWDTEN